MARGLGFVGVLLVAGSALGSVPAQAHHEQFCRFDPPVVETYQGSDPRVREEWIDGTRVVVLVPPHYDRTSRRYPVVWLFHGGLSHEDCFLLKTDLIAFTRSQPPDRQAIVAMPDGGAASAWVDSRDGQLRDETRFMEMFISEIDARYRTVPSGRYRAIAGFSAGAFGAAHLAARYPDRFAALAGLSGLLEMREDHWFTGVGYATAQYWWPLQWGGTISPEGSIGYPVLEQVRWRDIDPVSLASNFAGVDVTIFSGNGVPCDEWDRAHGHRMGPLQHAEALIVHGHSHHLSDALRAAGIRHTFRPRSCGLHHYGWVERDLHAWWPTLWDSFGSPRPRAFDHRRAIPSFSAWGWTFTADAARAPEFLDVADASCRSVGLTGSGVTTVTTARCFRSGVTVELLGAREATVVADAEGRISFTVDLGPAHEHQQFSAAARALEAAGGYWTSKTITFRRVP